LREPSKPIEVPISCQASIRGNREHNFTSTASRFSCLFDRHHGRVPSRRRSHCAKFQTSTSDKSPHAFRAHKRTRLLGHAMGLFSAGFPTGVGVRLTLPHPTLRTGSPLPTWGRPHWPPESSTATSATI